MHPATRTRVAANEQFTQDNESPRVVILTAVEVEFDAILRHLPGTEEIRCGTDGAIYQRALVRTPGGPEWEVFVRRTGRGNTAAGKEALDSFRRLSPQVMLFVGVAGGLKDVRLGDVVVAESVGQYDVGKVVSEGKGAVGQLLPRGSVYRPDPELLDRARQEAWTGRWVERIQSTRVIPIRKTPPKAIVEPIVSGEKVIAELKSYEGTQLRLLSSQSVAVEMEGFGFLHVLNDKPTKSLIIRGISDLVSDKAAPHDAKWQPIAAATAAAFAFEVIERFAPNAVLVTPPTVVDSTRIRLVTNISEFTDPVAVGREAELLQMQDFWDDEFSRTLSIVGQGGVGKTALLDQFVYGLLTRSFPPRTRPDPEAIIYLTAKSNYGLPYLRRAPESQRFSTLRRIYEVALDALQLGQDTDGDMASLRKSVLKDAREMKMLFALDNLESLSPIESEALGKFLSEIPADSKAVVTTRVDRRLASSIELKGLPTAAAQELFLRRLAADGGSVMAADFAHLDELVSYSKGVPLVLVHCAHAMSRGLSLEQTLEKLQSKEFVDLLQFSFESSFRELSRAALSVLYFVALSKFPVSRRQLAAFTKSDEELDAIQETLFRMDFLRRTWEEKKQFRFSIDNPTLRDYAVMAIPEMLTAEESELVRDNAGLARTRALPASVSIAVERAIRRASALESHQAAIDDLEAVRKEFGDDPRLLHEIGYRYFRLKELGRARGLLEKAVAKGSRIPDLFAVLALVLLFQNEYEEALDRATTALELRPGYPWAAQIAAQALLLKEQREAFALDNETRIRLIQEAQSRLNESQLAAERPDSEHNRRTEELKREAADRMSRLRASMDIRRRVE